MIWILDFLHLLSIGVPGWIALRLLRIPASTMMGAMLSAAIFSVNGWRIPHIPFGANILLQMILGLVIGVRFTREAGSELKKSSGVALLAGIWWIFLPLGLGWLVSVLFDLDLPTALLGTVPGGIAEMSILALSLNADAAMVALMQFFRVTFVLVGMPLLSVRINRSLKVESTAREIRALPKVMDEEHNDRLSSTILTLVLTAAGGLTGAWLGLPAGAFVGAMVFTGAASVGGRGTRPIPVIFRDIGQLGLGALIGLNATPKVLEMLWVMLLPTLGITVIMLGWGMLLALVVRRSTGWSVMTCLLATCPGGITTLAPIAEELGADPMKVSLLHLVRLFTIFLVLPPLIKIAIAWWG